MSLHLLIFGAGSHGKVVADAARLSGEFASISFLDDRFPELRYVASWPVIGCFDDIVKFTKGHVVAFGVGNNNLRMELCDKLDALGIDYPVIRHPSSIVAERVTLGNGSVLMAGSIINIDTSIGKCSIINTGATIDHDCELGDGVHISPGAHIAGGVKIADRVTVGIGASIINNIKIGKECFVGAGAVVIRNVESGVTVAGCPAKPISSRR